MNGVFERYPLLYIQFCSIYASSQFLLRSRDLVLIETKLTCIYGSVVATFAPMQNATGGFGGGHGQMSHCAPSYAVVLSLAMVGGEDAFRLVNRTTM